MCDHKEGKYSTIRLLEGEEEAQDIKDTITICLKRETVTRQQDVAFWRPYLLVVISKS